MRAISFADRVRPMALNTGSVPTLAADLGYMEREGLEAEMVEFDGTPPALAALEKGEVEFAQANIAPVVDRVANGAPLRIVWGSVHGDPLNPPPGSPGAGLLLVSSRSFSGVGDLKGARIGISLKGATNHHALIPVLRDHGIDPEKGVRWIEGGTPNERVNKLLNGGIDATVTTSQTLALFEGRSGDFRIIARGDDFAKTAGIQFLVVVAKEGLVEAEPNAVLSGVKALIRAARDFSKSPKGWTAAAARRRPDVGAEVISKCWEQSRGHWPVNGRLGPVTVQEAVARLKVSGEILAVPSAPAREWVVTRFVDGALSDLGEAPES